MIYIQEVGKHEIFLNPIVIFVFILYNILYAIVE